MVWGAVPLYGYGYQMPYALQMPPPQPQYLPPGYPAQVPVVNLAGCLTSLQSDNQHMTVAVPKLRCLFFADFLPTFWRPCTTSTLLPDSMYHYFLLALSDH
jgi:hypothetical protein